MDISVAVSEGEPLIRAVEQSLAKLAACVRADTGFAFAQLDVMDTEALTGAQARALIAEQFTIISHPTGNNERLPAIFAACTASEETRAAAKQCNDAKDALKGWHKHCRDIWLNAMDEKLASEQLRRVLTLAGYPQLLLSRADRKVTTFDQAAQRISWTRETAAVTKRQTLADAVDTLMLMPETPEINDEIARLTAEGLTKPVSHRLRRASVRAIACKVRLIDGARHARSEACYGAAPILIGPEPTITPRLHLPTTKGAPRGTKTTVNKESPVSPFLPGWFHYKRVPRKAGTQRREQNPHAKTLYSGIWIGFRMRKDQPTQYFMVARADGLAPKTFNISRLGREAAWRQAAALHADTTGLPLAEIEANIPDVTHIRAALAFWVERQSG